jgi:hypothetical protein
MDGGSTGNCSGTPPSKHCTRLQAVNSINYYYLLYYFCTVPYGLHPCFVHVDNASRRRRTSAPSSNPCKSSDPLWQPFMSSGRRWTEPGAAPPSPSSLDFREPARNFFCGDAIEGGDVPSSGRCRTERRAAPPPLSQFVALAAGSRRGSVVPSDLACP